MTTDLVPPQSASAGTAPPREGFLDRLRRRRHAADRDRGIAALAELHVLRALLADAATVVEAGWVQDGWFAYSDEKGRRHVVTALTAHRAQGHPIVGACLVGAVVEAGGGLAAVRTQPVQRALDLLWHTLYLDVGEPVRWCPSPPVRAAHLRDLTRWNDQPGRTRADAAALLRDADRVARGEIQRLREALDGGVPDVRTPPGSSARALR